MPHQPLYNASVPVFIRYLTGLDRILQKVEQLPLQKQQAVLAARLAPDMMNFLQQAETAIQFSLRTLLPVAGQAVPAFYLSDDVASLRKKLASRIEIMAGVSPDVFRQADEAARVFTERAGHATVQLSLMAFVHEFSLPNFLFHVSMAYAIARAQGVAIGKGTYDGFHVY